MSNAEPITCDVCRAPFKTLRGLAIHRSRMHAPARTVQRLSVEMDRVRLVATVREHLALIERQRATLIELLAFYDREYPESSGGASGTDGQGDGR